MALDVAGQIGTIGCHGWSGTIASARNNPDVFSRPGVNYSGFQLLQKRAPSSSIQTVTVTITAADALTVKKEAESYVGTVVKIRDPLYQVWNSVRVDDVIISIKTCKGNSGRAGTQAVARVDISWTLEALQ